jgi:hypothetical protein
MVRWKNRISSSQAPFAPELDLRVRNPVIGGPNGLTEIDSALRLL